MILTLLIVLLVLLAAVGAFTVWHNRRNIKAGKQDMTEAAVALRDRFHRVRPGDGDADRE